MSVAFKLANNFRNYSICRSCVQSIWSDRVSAPGFDQNLPLGVVGACRWEQAGFARWKYKDVGKWEEWILLLQVEALPESGKKHSCLSVCPMEIDDPIIKARTKKIPFCTFMARRMYFSRMSIFIWYVTVAGKNKPMAQRTALQESLSTANDDIKSSRQLSLSAYLHKN